MTDESSAKLLAHVEALMAEVQGLRRDLQDDRDVRAEAEGRLAATRQLGAERQRRFREAQTVTLPNVTSRYVTLPSQVVKAVDLDQVSTTTKQKTARVTSHNVSNVTTGPVWLAYATAYEARYQTKPVRNAKVNGQLVQLVKRLGEEAAEVAAFYVGHRAAYYQQKGHAIGPLLADAEKLRMEWFTGKQITATAARQQERTAANAEGWGSLLINKEPKNGLG